MILLYRYLHTLLCYLYWRSRDNFIFVSEIMAEPIGKVHSALAGLKNKTADALKTDGVVNVAQKDIMGVLNTSPLSLKLNDL